MDCSPPGSFVHGISQARILEWAVISFSRGSVSAQGSNPHLPHWQVSSISLSHQGSPKTLRADSKGLTCRLLVESLGWCSGSNPISTYLPVVSWDSWNKRPQDRLLHTTKSLSKLWSAGGWNQELARVGYFWRLWGGSLSCLFPVFWWCEQS